MQNLPGLRALLGVSLLLACTGCYSTTAVVVHETAEGREKTVGTIIAGDELGLYIEDESSGGIQRIDKKKIVKLKHPGDSKAVFGAVSTLAGTVLVVLGSVAIADTLDKPSGSADAITDPFVATFGGVMALIGTVGLTLGIPAIVGATESRADSLERMGTPPLRVTGRVAITLKGTY